MSNSWTASARTWASSKRILRNPCNHYSIGLQGNLESEKAGKLYAEDFAEDLSGAIGHQFKRPSDINQSINASFGPKTNEKQSKSVEKMSSQSQNSAFVQPKARLKL